MKKGDHFKINLKMSLMMDISQGTWEVESTNADSTIICYVGDEDKFEGGDRRARYNTADIAHYID